MSIRVKTIVVWRTEVEDRPGEMARALEPLVEHDLDLVIGNQGTVVDIAPVVGRKARLAAEKAGFRPLPMSMILVEGENRRGVCFGIARALGNAGIGMNSMVGQAAGTKYQVLVGVANEADAKRAASVIRKAAGSKSRRQTAEKS